MDTFDVMDVNRTQAERIKELEEALTAISINSLDAARAKQVADEALIGAFPKWKELTQ